MADCSHGNSEKQPVRQEEVLASLLATRRSGWREADRLHAGEQPEGGPAGHPGGSRKLEYGVSVTDPCIGWETTERLLEAAFRAHEI